MGLDDSEIEMPKIMQLQFADDEHEHDNDDMISEWFTKSIICISFIHHVLLKRFYNFYWTPFAGNRFVFVQNVFFCFYQSRYFSPQGGNVAIM